MTALGLFGGEVRGGAHDGTGLGETLFDGRTDRAGDAEVGHLHVPGRAHDDVGGLDVAVHHAGFVRFAQRGGDVESDVAGL